jgi:imidazole glycerol-phosphate synthase subunit HisH
VTAVVVVDNGGANTASVLFALERLGAPASLSADAARIAAAPRVILPGVGAARDGMQRLARSGLDSVIRGLRQPLLGICLGMQLLYEGSAEGETDCLALIPGRARRFDTGPDRPVPHMGWNTLAPSACALLAGIEAGDYVYFVHSYALPPGPDTVATCEYGGRFCAAVSRGNFHGVQFHPERSAAVGARLLANFLALGV